jgi:hypothetical protein
MPVDEEFQRRLNERARISGQEWAGQAAEARRPPTLAEKNYGKTLVDGKVARQRWISEGFAKSRQAAMRRTINARVTGPYAPRRPPTEKEIDAAIAALYPRPGPPPKPWVHVPGLPQPELRPALTIKEAIGTSSQVFAT